jgi:hypothetical protein
MADENFAAAVVVHLRLRGHDVLTCVEADLANRSTPDDEVLAFAAAQGRALLTFNRQDFIRLHKAGVSHAGIVICTEDRDYAGQAARIEAAVGGAEALDGQLIRVNRPS